MNYQCSVKVAAAASLVLHSCDSLDHLMRSAVRSLGAVWSFGLLVCGGHVVIEQKKQTVFCLVWHSFEHNEL
jgi:hypothetical protein